MNISPVRAVVGAFLTLFVVGALLSVPTTATAEPTTAAATAPVRPTVGSCHNLSLREAYQESDPDAPVDCARRHTSRTFLVPTVPAKIRMTNMDALGNFVSRRCGSAYQKVVSPQQRLRLMSSYAMFWFAPTAAQVRQGARWVRCDVTLLGGTSLAPLPSTVRTPALGKAPHPDNEARCYMGEKQRYALTVCSRPHQYRVLKVFKGKGKAYPSERRLYVMSRNGCRPTAGPKWATLHPTKDEWKAGFRYFICTRQTTR